MKNWKSMLAFLVFISAYVYTISTEASEGVVEVSGYVALWSSLFMMIRSEMTTSLIEKIIDKMPTRN